MLSCELVRAPKRVVRSWFVGTPRNPTWTAMNCPASCHGKDGDDSRPKRAEPAAGCRHRRVAVVGRSVSRRFRRQSEIAARVGERRGIDPSEAWQLGESLGYSVSVRWSTVEPDRRFDVLFHRADNGQSRVKCSRTGNRPQYGGGRPWKEYANDPVRAGQQSCSVRGPQDARGPIAGVHDSGEHRVPGPVYR